MTHHILVIKLSALGDFVQNFGIMRAIRDHHKNDHITLLTTAPYGGLGKECGYFDDILIDPRPKIFEIGKWKALTSSLTHQKIHIVYDLQNNDRTRLYRSLFFTKTTWIGLPKKHNKNNLAFDRHKKLLEQAGISTISIDPLDWMGGDVSGFSLPNQYALIVPGCAPTRPEKRWPSDYFIAVCHHFLKKDITPVIIGTDSEKEIADHIASACPAAINLTGQTKLFDIPALGRSALIAIGNDTGPMHMIGPTGCLSLVLFSSFSDPLKHAPLGDNIHTMQEQKLNDLNPETVIDKINRLL